jgi:hypothetical protein
MKMPRSIIVNGVVYARSETPMQRYKRRLREWNSKTTSYKRKSSRPQPPRRR